MESHPFAVNTLHSCAVEDFHNLPAVYVVSLQEIATQIFP